MKTRRAIGVAIVLFGLLTPGFLARDAGAAGLSAIGTSNADYFDCVTGAAGCTTKRGYFKAYTPVTMHCWLDGRKAASSVRWFYVTGPGGITSGYVHSSKIPTRLQPKVPNCNTIRGIRASHWAATHVGAKTVAAAEKNGNKVTYWSGWCYLFAWDAHALSHGVKPRLAGTAKLAYNSYKASKRVTGYTKPESIPIGSLVFWPNVTGAGHAAIYVGNGAVVSTIGVEGEVRPVSRVSLTKQFGVPAGFVSPGNI